MDVEIFCNHPLMSGLNRSLYGNVTHVPSDSCTLDRSDNKLNYENTLFDFELKKGMSDLERSLTVGYNIFVMYLHTFTRVIS